MVRKSRFARKGAGQEETSEDRKDEREETRMGKQENGDSADADEREIGRKRGQAEKRGAQQDKGDDGAETAVKGKNQAGRAVGKGSGARAEIKRALSSHQYKGNVRLWLLREHLTSEAFDIHRLSPGIISKLGDGRCWRGEGEGFPGEVSTHTPPSPWATANNHGF